MITLPARVAGDDGKIAPDADQAIHTARCTASALLFRPSPLEVVVGS